MDSNANKTTENNDEPVRKRMRPGQYLSKDSIIDFMNFFSIEYDFSCLYCTVVKKFLWRQEILKNKVF